MALTTGKATDLITFSRGTLATTTDANGRIVWAPHNLLTNSEQFDRSPWAVYAATIAANDAVAPNGTTTADKYTYTGAGSAVFYDAIVPAGTHTVSCFFKLGTVPTSCTLAISSTAPNGIVATFNLSTFSASVATLGTGGTASGGTASVTSVGNGWFLCTLAGVLTTAVNAVIISFVGSNGQTGYLWGASLTRSDLGGMQANASAYPMYNPSTPKNLLGYSEDFSNAAWAKTRAGVTANSVAAPNGSLSADTLTATAASTTSHYLRQSVTMANSRCIFSVYAKAGTSSWIALQNDGVGGTLAFFNLTTGTVGSVGAGSIATITGVGDGWYRCAISQVAAAGSNAFDIFLASADNVVSFTAVGTETVYLWGAQLSDSASLDAYSPVFGAAPSAAAYHGPRLDYDPVTLSARGLLVEEARTNLLINSNTFTNYNYASPSSTITANTGEVIGVDGGATASKISFTGAGNDYAYRITSIAAGNTYSVWLRTLSGTRSVSLRCWNTGQSVAVSVTPVWQRFSITVAATEEYIGLDNRSPYGGAGTAGVIYAWGAQLEAGSFATSYIPTSSATVTRNADVASVGVSQFPYSASEGTLVVSGTLFANSGNGPLVSMTDGTSNNGVSLAANATNGFTGFAIRTSGSAQADIFAGSTAAAGLIKIAGAWKSNDATYAVGGTIRGTPDTTVTPPSLTQMVFPYGLSAAGAGSSGSSWIRQITYIPRRLSDAELQSRTA